MNAKDDALERARGIRLVALDVDGVLTDGSITLGDFGEAKTFYARDGLGISVARSTGIRFAIVTGRGGTPVERRARELNIEHVFTGCRAKGAAIAELAEAAGLTADQIAYFGDDWNDVPAMLASGLSICPGDGADGVRCLADAVTEAPGGRGAVREFLEWLLDAQDGWTEAAQKWVAAEGGGQ